MKPFYLLVFALVLAQACPSLQSGGSAGSSQSPIPIPGAQPLPTDESGNPDNTDSVKPQATLPAGQAMATEDAALQARIQSTLGHDATLSHDSVRVSVSGDSIELTGSVGTSRERLTATRLAMSYAGSKRVISRITVGSAAGNPPLEPTPAKKNATGSQRAASPLKSN